MKPLAQLLTTVVLLATSVQVLSALPCGPYQHHDPAVKMCINCSTLCGKDATSGQLKICKEDTRCQAYLAANTPTTTATTTTTSIATASTSKKPMTPSEKTVPVTPKADYLVWVYVGVPTLLVAATVVGIVIACRKCRNRRRHLDGRPADPNVEDPMIELEDATKFGVQDTRPHEYDDSGFSSRATVATQASRVHGDDQETSPKTIIPGLFTRCY